MRGVSRANEQTERSRIFALFYSQHGKNPTTPGDQIEQSNNRMRWNESNQSD